MFASDKHSSLLGPLISYEKNEVVQREVMGKKFYSTDHRSVH
jgi:hypothetical protein